MSELVDRYVTATLRSIPEKQRPEIEAELRASIEDEIEARADSGASVDAAEEAVLTALGDPDRLAAGYTGRPGYLIGPELFYDYKRLVTVLLVTVVPIILVVMAVLKIVGGDDFGSVVADSIGTAITVALNIVFWTTLIFAWIERSDERPTGTEWSIDRLPVARSASSVSLGETIGSIVALAFAITLLSLAGSASPLTSADGSPVPFFDPALQSFWIPFFIVVLSAEVLFELVKYKVGRWTWPLASFNLALNAAFAVPAVYLLATSQVVNPEFFETLGWGTAPEAGSLTISFAIVVIVAIALWDVFDGFRKARKA